MQVVSILAKVMQIYEIVNSSLFGEFGCVLGEIWMPIEGRD